MEFTEGLGSDAQWQTLARPGYFGKRKADILAGYEQEFGKDNWRLAWIVQGSIFDLERILMLYEDGYYHYLKQRTDLLDTLVAEAADVYEDAPSNVQCGLDYTAQESNINHFQDISLRRVVARLGCSFEGSHARNARAQRTTLTGRSTLSSPGVDPSTRA